MPVLLCQHGFWQPNYDPPAEPPSVEVSPIPKTGAPIEPPLTALRAATSVAPAGVSTSSYPRLPIEASGLARPIEAPRLAPRATNPGPDRPKVPVPLPALQATKAESPSTRPIRAHSGLPREASQASLLIEALRLATLAATPGSDRLTVLAPLPSPLAAEAHSGSPTTSHSGTPFEALRLARPIEAPHLALSIEALRLAPLATTPGPDRPTVPAPLPEILRAKAGSPGSSSSSNAGARIEASRMAPLATAPGASQPPVPVTRQEAPGAKKAPPISVPSPSFEASLVAPPPEASRLAPPATSRGTDQATIQVPAPVSTEVQHSPSSAHSTVPTEAPPTDRISQVSPEAPQGQSPTGPDAQPVHTTPESASDNNQSHDSSTGKQVHSGVRRCVHLGRICRKVSRPAWGISSRGETPAAPSGTHAQLFADSRSYRRPEEG
jgi:hypothetical protein